MSVQRWRAGALVAVLVLSASRAALAAPWMSTSVFALRTSFEDCRQRVAKALAAEGYGETRDFGNGWLGFTATHSAAVGCIHGRDETVVSIVVASESDNTPQRDRLGALIRGGGTIADERRLKVSFSAAGGVVVSWSDLPGSATDWISVVPAGSPDDTYGSSWGYLGGQRFGSRDFGPLPAGEYEARLYYDWPNGGFRVQVRVRFRVAG